MKQTQQNRGRSTAMTASTATASPAPSRAHFLDMTTRSLTRDHASEYVWALARLSMGWIFFWPFVDKLFGLGHETESPKAWINGGNPTEGFLSGAVGPLSGVYHSIAGDPWVNVLFMTGLLVIAVGLLLGIYMRFACGAGALMLVLMWSASLPPANNVFMDDHIIFALLLAGLALGGAGRTLGLGRRWSRGSAVRAYPWLG